MMYGESGSMAGPRLHVWPSHTPTHSRKPDHARRLRDLIRSRLLDSEFRGGRLPDEAQLMIEYGAGRNVVRAALAHLRDEGLIARTQGAGTFALKQKTRHTLREAHGLARSVAGHRTQLATRVVSAQEVPAPADLAQRLSTDAGALCLVVDLITEIDGQPAMVLTSYIADETAQERVMERILPGEWIGDWYDALTAAGLEPKRRDVIVEAVVADDFVAPLLQQRVGDPIMRFERRLVLGDLGVHEYGFACCRGDLLAFVASDSASTWKGILG
jgi:GntR family transcriptional regulator